jgi:hypothetical protein
MKSKICVWLSGVAWAAALVNVIVESNSCKKDEKPNFLGSRLPMKSIKVGSC